MKVRKTKEMKDIKFERVEGREMTQEEVEVVVRILANWIIGEYEVVKHP